MIPIEEITTPKHIEENLLAFYADIFNDLPTLHECFVRLEVSCLAVKEPDPKQPLTTLKADGSFMRDDPKEDTKKALYTIFDAIGLNDLVALDILRMGDMFSLKLDNGIPFWTLPDNSSAYDMYANAEQPKSAPKEQLDFSHPDYIEEKVLSGEKLLEYEWYERRFVEVLNNNDLAILQNTENNVQFIKTEYKRSGDFFARDILNQESLSELRVCPISLHLCDQKLSKERRLKTTNKKKAGVEKAVDWENVLKIALPFYASDMYNFFSNNERVATIKKVYEKCFSTNDSSKVPEATHVSKQVSCVENIIKYHVTKSNYY